MKAAELFDRGFNSSTSLAGYSLESLPASASISPPDMRSVICDRRGPMPEEDSQTTVAEGETTPNLLSSGVFAFAGGAQPMRTTLGPRAIVQPVPVWIGMNPPSEADIAAQAAAEDAADQARQAKKIKKIAKKPDPKATDKKITDKADEEKGAETVKKENGRASVALKPVSDAAKKVDAKADLKADPKKAQAAKPQAAADAKVPPKRPVQKPKAKDGSDDS
jgi:D-alanyl-D-alanine carboxypeptidase